jgi:hypothetical protein
LCTVAVLSVGVVVRIATVGARTVAVALVVAVSAVSILIAAAVAASVRACAAWRALFEGFVVASDGLEKFATHECCSLYCCGVWAPVPR